MKKITLIIAGLLVAVGAFAVVGDVNGDGECFVVAGCFTMPLYAS
ncbi:MAG: hypothetical protein SPL78_04520 [Bacteroidales bacterium]|nr:hypothetical protein [Bacteroidales bacterium]